MGQPASSDQQGRLHLNPLYKQVEQDIRARIESGQWLPNMILPSRPKLAKEYGVGLTTIERAIDRLIEDGVLRAEANRGTFVADVAPLPAATPASPARILEQISPLPPLSFPNVMNSPTLGIITANDLDWSLEREGTYDWLMNMLSSLEQAFSLFGGRTLYVKRYLQQGIHLSVRDAIKSALAQNVNALVIVNVNDAQQIMEDVHELLDVQKFPLVTHSWLNEHPLLPHIDYDNRSSGYLAGRHMLEAGYEPLLFIDPMQQWWSNERLQGVQAALRSLRYPEDILIHYCKEHYGVVSYNGSDIYNYTVDLGYDIGKDLLNDVYFASTASTRPPPGLIASNDPLAFGLHKALVEAGKQPGKDFGLLGFDDDLPSRKLGLTTLRPPLEDMGIEAARLILQKLRGNTTVQQVRHSSHLIVRTSTRRT